jgi:hypothetical protein
MGWRVVFVSVTTYLPSRPRSFAFCAAAAMSPSESPSSSATSSTTTADSFVSARIRSRNCVVSFASSWLSSRSVDLSASESCAPARTKSR